MSVDLRVAACEYLAGRRARGYRLADSDWLLSSFLDGLQARGRSMITVADAMAFAQQQPGTQRLWQAARLRAVRGLAAYVHGLDPDAAQLIPAGLIPARTRRRIPYLYTDEQITMLMARAAILTPATVAASVNTLIGLLAATGLRSGEAIALDVGDIDVEASVLTVTGKYGRQRLVPLHVTALHALTVFQQRYGHDRSMGPLLIGARGGRLNPNMAREAFRSVVDACRLPARPGCGVPRLHDIRHTFAVNSLIDAHRNSVDVDARLAVLAIHLGHVNPANTYWYLSASPELMGLVSDRMTPLSAHPAWSRP